MDCRQVRLDINRQECEDYEYQSGSVAEPRCALTFTLGAELRRKLRCRDSLVLLRHWDLRAVH